MKMASFCQELEMQEIAFMGPTNSELGGWRPSLATAPMAIGICGGSGSGKTTLAQIFLEQLGADSCCVLAQDNYYRDQSERFDEDGGLVNFDHPDSIDFPLMAKHLSQLLQGQAAQVPQYDFATHQRLKSCTLLQSRPIILVDGTLILHHPQVRSLLKTSVFLEIPEEVRFSRRLNRDVEKRGRLPEGVKKQFNSQVKPMHDLFVGPSRQWAKWALADNKLDQDIVKKMIASLFPHPPHPSPKNLFQKGS